MSATNAAAMPGRIDSLRARFDGPLACLPGLALAVVVAAAARFGAEHVGGPPTIHALAIGLLLGFLASEPSCRPGLDFAGRSVLRIGIALLGLQVSLATLASLGPVAPILVLLIVASSIGLGIGIGRLLGFETDHAIVAACATSICGASAAMAVAAIMPRSARLQPVKCMIVTTVALLSTIAMLAYPLLLHAMGLDDRLAGFVIGAAIHDVAQVVSAGFSVSDEAGQVATLIKLVRVASLLPVIVLFGIWLRSDRQAGEEAARPPLLPAFMIAFAALIVLNSAMMLPKPLLDVAGEISRWCLIIAIAALGIQTSMRQMASGGAGLMALLLIQSFVLLGLALGAAALLGR